LAKQKKKHTTCNSGKAVCRIVGGDKNVAGERHWKGPELWDGPEKTKNGVDGIGVAPEKTGGHSLTAKKKKSPPKPQTKEKKKSPETLTGAGGVKRPPSKEGPKEGVGVWGGDTKLGKK